MEDYLTTHESCLNDRQRLKNPDAELAYKIDILYLKKTHEGLLTNIRKRKNGLKMLCRVINCNNILNKVIYWETKLSV